MDKLSFNQNLCLLHGIGELTGECLLLKFLSSGPVCWRNEKESYGRGFGTIPPRGCPPHRPDRDGGLCYKRCRSGYKPFGCCLCKKGWSSYVRGVGTIPVPICPSHRPHHQAGFCYRKCRRNYKGVSSLVETTSTCMVVMKV